MHMQSQAKEGLSVFGTLRRSIDAVSKDTLTKEKSLFYYLGILNKTRTAVGKNLFKQWFLHPTLDIAVLEERHHTIDCFLQSDNVHVSEQLSACLKHIKNIPKILENMRKKLLIASEWQGLLQ